MASWRYNSYRFAIVTFHQEAIDPDSLKQYSSHKIKRGVMSSLKILRKNYLS